MSHRSVCLSVLRGYCGRRLLWLVLILVSSGAVIAAPCPPEVAALQGKVLRPGMQGPAVITLQQALTTAGFYRGPRDGRYGNRVQAAVIAVHKALDRPRRATWQPDDWQALCRYDGPTLPIRGQPDRLEIDLGRQVLYLIKNAELIAVLPVSSGNGRPYRTQSGQLVNAQTPVGHFRLYGYHNGWRRSYLGELYRPWYFQGGYAVHGSRSVPPQPASHGCVRVPMWEADYLAGELKLGMPVYIWP